MTFSKKKTESAQAPPSGCGGSDRGEGETAARAGGEPGPGAPTRRELSDSVRHSYDGFKSSATGWAEGDFVGSSKRS